MVVLDAENPFEESRQQSENVKQSTSTSVTVVSASVVGVLVASAVILMWRTQRHQRQRTQTLSSKSSRSDDFFNLDGSPKCHRSLLRQSIHHATHLPRTRGSFLNENDDEALEVKAVAAEDRIVPLTYIRIAKTGNDIECVDFSGESTPMSHACTPTAADPEGCPLSEPTRSTQEEDMSLRADKLGDDDHIMYNSSHDTLTSESGSDAGEKVNRDGGKTIRAIYPL